MATREEQEARRAAMQDFVTHLITGKGRAASTAATYANNVSRALSFVGEEVTAERLLMHDGNLTSGDRNSFRSAWRAWVAYRVEKGDTRWPLPNFPDGRNKHKRGVENPLMAQLAPLLMALVESFDPVQIERLTLRDAFRAKHGHGFDLDGRIVPVHGDLVRALMSWGWPSKSATGDDPLVPAMPDQRGHAMKSERIRHILTQGREAGIKPWKPGA